MLMILQLDDIPILLLYACTLRNAKHFFWYYKVI